MDESYSTDSGFFTDYEGTVTDAYFGVTEKKPDDWNLFLEMKTDSPDRPEHLERYKLGQGWSSSDGGATVSNDQGRRKFHKRYSDYAKWIDAAVPLLVRAGVAEEFSARGPSTSASVWVGTRWQIEEQVEKQQRWDTNAKKLMVDDKGDPVFWESHVNVPVAFLGMAGDAAGNGHKPDVDLSFIPDTLRDQLVAVAKAAPNVEAWRDRMYLDVPEIQQVEGLVGQLAPAKVYEGLKSS